uniref:MAT1-1-2 n=1 Tax=Hypocrella siamensis TaxID=696354 RepID=A0A0P0BZ31_9HYPO|nr:MAT1-1-2 [Hypocrella siamensis]
MDIIKQLLKDLSDNKILQKLRADQHGQHAGAHSIVKCALMLWYIASVPIISRDSHQGLPPDSTIGVDEHGANLLTWSRRFSHKKHAVGNLGIMAMLMTTESWLRPKHPNLKAASLVSNATTTLLLASYLIHPVAMENPWAFGMSSAQFTDALHQFIRTSWHIARENYSAFDCPPGCEFGATLNEVKLADDGKRLLTRIGRDSWQEAPHWHPCRRVPGSSWNKYLKNWSQPMFSSKPITNRKVVITLPSTMLDLARPWEIYYTDLRARFDSVSSMIFELLLLAGADQDTRQDDIAWLIREPCDERSTLIWLLPLDKIILQESSVPR